MLSLMINPRISAYYNFILSLYFWQLLCITLRKMPLDREGLAGNEVLDTNLIAPMLT
jgi:hypothetical protein